MWITDTAGLREVEGKIEEEAVRRTHAKLGEANIILLMVDGSRPLGKEDIPILERTEKEKTLLIVNKMDLPQRINKERINSFFPVQAVVEISATEEINLEKLKERIAEFALKEAALSFSDSFILSIRQEQALEEAKRNIERALLGKRGELFEELTAFDLKEAIDSLGEITGEVVADDVLEEIFSHFCIGK